MSLWIPSNQDKLDCVTRELGYRERVYSRMVTEGRMKREKAERELTLMTAIAEDYKALLKAERLL